PLGPLVACSLALVAGLQRACYLNPLEHLDPVASAHVVVVLHADTALHAVPYFADVILEATQGFQLAFVDDHVFTQYPDRPVTVDRALDDHTTGHRPELRRTEHVTHFGNTKDLLAHIAAKHARQGLLDVFDDLVDHAVVAQIQAFGLDHLARRGIGTDVEAEDHGVGSQRQVGIGLGDTAHATGYDLDLDFVVAQLVQRALQCFQRTAHVGLDDDIERLLLALAHVLEHVLQLGRLLTGQLDLAELALTEQRDFPRLLLVSHHGHLVTRFRGAIQAEDRDGNGRAGFFHQVAVFVKHGTHPAVVQAGQHHVALTQGTVLDQYGGNRATALVQPRLDDYTAGRSRGLGLELKHLGLQQDRFQQIVDTSTDL